MPRKVTAAKKGAKNDKAMPDKRAASKAKRQRQDEGSSPDAAMFDLEPDHEPEATIETADEVEPKNDKKKQSTPKGKQPAAKAKQTQEDIKGKGKQIQEDIKGKGKEIQENIEDMGNISERKQQKQLPEPKVRKGITSSLRTAPVKETPGNPKYPNTFISIESNEQKVGAYLGYNDVVDIRKLALSWPALKAFRCFNKIAKHLNKMTAFRLLYDNESVFTDVDYQREWKILEDDSTSQVRDKKARHLAAILLQMEKDFGLMQEISQKDNRKLQSFHIGAIRRELPGGENFPLVDYKRLEGERSNETLLPVVAMPVLGPYATETRLESINRCWNLLKYFRYCHQAGLWPSRFTMEGVCQRIIIDASHIPEWLRPPDNIPERPDELAKTPAVEAADRLEARDYRIVWDLDIPFNGKAQLDEILQAAKASNIQIPSTDQKLSEDPRLSASAASFRDSIRRQFNCQRLSINIRTLELQYTNLALSQSRLHRDILRDDWVDTQSTFADSANSEFVVHVQFEALDDPEEGIYESFQPPPAIAAFFDTSSGEVRSNAVSVAQIAAAAFDDKDKQLEAAESSPTNNLPTFLELAFGHGGSACDIGAPPDPKKKFPKQSQHHALLRYYDGIDVTDKEGRRKWQRQTLEALTMNAQVASVKLDKLPNSLTKEQSLAIQEAQFIGERMAMARESDDGSGEVTTYADEQRYYTMQTAFSGTQSRAGPPVDLCLQLLDCEILPNGKVRSRLLNGVTDTEFFNYQISGAVGIALKLYGRIDADALLRGTSYLDNPRAADIRQAAVELKDVKIHGCIMADEVGFGKTKQVLLAAYLHTILSKEEEDGELLFRPILLVVPPTLINQWLEELRSHWPCFRSVISYEDHEFKQEMALSAISHTAMKEYPSLEALPRELRYIFDKRDKKAGKTIIITSYETHKGRTGKKKQRRIPGIPYKKPRYTKDGEPIWKKKPRIEKYWVTNHQKVYSLLIADEAQKIKNYSSGTWSVLFCHNFPKTILATATPMFNSVRDLTALIALLWPAVLADISESEGTPESDYRRVRALDPVPLRRAATSLTGLHLSVANKFKETLDLAAIQRSSASVLPVSRGEPIPLRGLFKKIIRKTAVIERQPNEEVEYQYWHRIAADEYVNEVSLRGDPGLPTKPTRVHEAGNFISATGPLRRLAMANFATKMARLNAVMECVKSNTHVATLTSWRDQGFEADFIQDLTRGAGEKKVLTARELLEYLCDGSPVARLTFQEILTVKCIEEIDKSYWKSHQKLIIAESHPGNAFYLHILLRCALIDARVMHAGLSNRAKSELVDLFNDPQSTLQVLIMMFDVGAVGLNLHKACNRVLITSIARNYAQESQVAGRALRVTSEFPLTVVRRETPNSHDQFRNARQADKATVQLAANSNDPAIRRLVIDLLNELQPEVNACHQSEEGQKLLQEIKEKNRTRAITLAERKRISRAEIECEVCVSLFGSEDEQHTCSVCGTLAHLPCLGLGEEITDKDNVIYLQCQNEGNNTEGRKSTLRSARHKDVEDDDTDLPEDDGVPLETEDETHDSDYDDDLEKKSESETDDEGGTSDCEDAIPQQARFATQQAKEEMLEAQDEAMFIKSEELADFVSREQPSDETRHMTALLSLPPGKVWTEDDLDDEANVKVGLHLLYNKIQGKHSLHFGKSIHIKYKAFPSDVQESMLSERKVSNRQVKAAKKILRPS